MSGKTDISAGKAGNAALTGRPCPICGKPGTMDYRPFCSRRCADVDLNRWLSGAYAIPVAQDEDEDGLSPLSEPRE